MRQFATALRIAAGCLGWLLSYFFILAFVGPEITTCTQASDDAWISGLIFDVPAFLAGLLLVAQAKPWSPWLRFGALPHSLTLVSAALIVPRHFYYSTWMGLHVCDVHSFPESFGKEASAWHYWYWPIQVVLLGSLIGFISWFSRRPRAPAA